MPTPCPADDESFRRRRLSGVPQGGDDAALDNSRRDGAAPWRGGLNDYACPGDAMTVWLNRSDVRKALNIQPNNRFNSADNGVGMNCQTLLPMALVHLRFRCVCDGVKLVPLFVLNVPCCCAQTR